LYLGVLPVPRRNKYLLIPIAYHRHYGRTSFLSEMFPSNLRYTGASLGYQIAAPIGGGLVPLAAAALVELTHGATWPVSVLMILIALTTVLAVLAARETAPKLAHLGDQPRPPSRSSHDRVR
jgi:MFS family permease